jgi:hypothetical protein
LHKKATQSQKDAHLAEQPEKLTAHAAADVQVAAVAEAVMAVEKDHNIE